MEIYKTLEDANKQIFVKSYEKAWIILNHLCSSDDGKDNLMVHLRRIELALKLGRVEEIRKEYLKNNENFGENKATRIALALLELHAEIASPDASFSLFQQMLKEYGPIAALYYGMAFSMELMANQERAIFNYEQSIKIDPAWYPSYFGLSQIYYNLEDNNKGDQYFYLFENSAPYNVYGNFETHKKLYDEFIQFEQLPEAEAAITTLSEWWLDNKGFCPPEIQIYEALALGKISGLMNNYEREKYYSNLAVTIGRQILQEKNSSEGILFFIARSLEEYSQFELALDFYKKILANESTNPSTIQKIGGQFLSMGENHLAKELFEEAYRHNPDRSEIRFCLLVANLKIARVNVEEYLIDKERMKNLMAYPNEKVELLSLLHSLIARFSGDPDVQGNLGEAYLQMGNVERASFHYKKMYEIDSRSRITTLRYASFEMQYGDTKLASLLLEDFVNPESFSKEDLTELYWLKAIYHHREGDFQNSHKYLLRVLELDPWNVLYLTQEILNLTAMLNPEAGIARIDPVIQKLRENDERNIDWSEYNRVTDEIMDLHAHELAYVRSKVAYVFSSGDFEQLKRLVNVARRFDPGRGTYDFLRLLNTNFDSALIYLALGILFKENWQLETACMWFEQTLNYPKVDNSIKATTYLELSDCFNWRNHNIPKAIEYAKLAIELGERDFDRSYAILSHSLLKLGDMRGAQKYLDMISSQSPYSIEAQFLSGLLKYRNGDQVKAREIWKPLITHASKDLRFHTIKQEILKFYFDKAPYLSNTN
ncbi:MAG: hypothetical protein HQK54_06710 [Oligoflexales bacterium]|nr:hypothetical protein [Oligoflexales bacterium]